MESQHIGCKENEPKERLMGKIILGVIQRISAWMNKYKNDHIHISTHTSTHQNTFIPIQTRLNLHTNVMPNTNKLILQLKHNWLNWPGNSHEQTTNIINLTISLLKTFYTHTSNSNYSKSASKHLSINLYALNL